LIAGRKGQARRPRRAPSASSVALPSRRFILYDADKMLVAGERAIQSAAADAASFCYVRLFNIDIGEKTGCWWIA